ncbi:hypothetical protein ACQQ2N_14310 [Dokdonella sp. MW10]|uniref:hypothetical protein n=1 Tax=Dokdonella sp. MW10 TaxID=2992926 RepID=UPI003F8231D7
MREAIEFRVYDDVARQWLPDDVGVRMGMARRLLVDVGDPLMGVIADAHRSMVAQGTFFITSWKKVAVYSAAELKSADAFLLKIMSVFEPSAEMCGTSYDDRHACPQCGSGGMQTSPLVLDTKKIPRKASFAKTISGEVVVSRTAVDVLRAHDVGGFSLAPVIGRGLSAKESSDWLQLLPSDTNADVVSPTRFGYDPFGIEQGGDGCPLGDCLGANLISRVFLDEESMAGRADVFCSRSFVGARRGYLRPERMMFILPRVRDIIQSHQLGGCEFEIAYPTRGD